MQLWKDQLADEYVRDYEELYKLNTPDGDDIDLASPPDDLLIGLYEKLAGLSSPDSEAPTKFADLDQQAQTFYRRNIITLLGAIEESGYVLRTRG